jgi:hypothetical protein
MVTAGHIDQLINDDVHQFTFSASEHPALVHCRNIQGDHKRAQQGAVVLPCFRVQGTTI